MFAVTNNLVDFAFVGLVIVSVLLYVGLQFWVDRGKGVEFTSLRKAFNELDMDGRSYSYVEDNERRDDVDYQ